MQTSGPDSDKRDLYANRRRNGTTSRTTNVVLGLIARDAQGECLLLMRNANVR